MSSNACALPTVTDCGDPNCDLLMCGKGLAAHDLKKPWFLTQKPVPKGTLIPDPIVLMKEGSWMLEKADEAATESNLHHYCPSMQWKKSISINEVRDGYCLECMEEVPEEVVAAYTLHNWQWIQQYDRDMALYEKQGIDVFETTPMIEVFR